MSGVFSIHKYPLTIGSPTLLQLPVGSEVLHVGQQSGTPMLWVRVPPPMVADPLPPLKRTIVCLGTGWSLDEHPGQKHVHIGTVQIGEFVWHFFEQAYVVVPMQFASQEAWGGVHSTPVNSLTPT